MIKFFLGLILTGLIVGNVHAKPTYEKVEGKLKVTTTIERIAYITLSQLLFEEEAMIERIQKNEERRISSKAILEERLVEIREAIVEAENLGIGE